jgi:hypothetical protein
LKGCEYFPQRIFSSTRLFFTLLQHFIPNPVDKFGELVVNSGLRLPTGTVDWQSWFDFVREGTFTFFPTAVFLLQLSKVDFFHYKNDEEVKHAKFTIISLHCGVMLCPEIARHPLCGKVIIVLRENLIRPFDDLEIEPIVQRLCALVQDVPRVSIELLASLMPVGGIGQKIMMLASVGIGNF